MAKRHTISINDEAYKRLRQKGTFGESYTTVILRILEQIDAQRNEMKDFE